MTMSVKLEVPSRGSAVPGRGPRMLHQKR